MGKGEAAAQQVGLHGAVPQASVKERPAPTVSLPGAAITGWGAALPDKVVTNADFAARLDTNDAWIVDRTGIRERRFGGTTTSLASEAATAALEEANLAAGDIDLLVLATTTPDKAVPATSSELSALLGCDAAAFDLNAACSGYVYALVTAVSMFSAGYRRALVIGSDTLSRITDMGDRSTAVLFGDGAGATVVEARPGRELILAHDLGTDGSLAPLLYCDHGGYIEMDGKELFRRAVRASSESAQRALESAGVKPDEIALFVPHQANRRIIDAVASRLGISPERSVIVLDQTGNTSSASVPIAISKAAGAGRLADGDLVLLSGFGAGMTWASAVLRWGGSPG
ncbi:MAG: beta-ketoacyl-ACP synthase III [Acidimicrobiales bacterium]